MDPDELPCEVPIWSVAGNPVAGGQTKVDRVLDIIRFGAAFRRLFLWFDVICLASDDDKLIVFTMAPTLVWPWSCGHPAGGWLTDSPSN